MNYYVHRDCTGAMLDNEFKRQFNPDASASMLLNRDILVHVFI